jgi:hypothetical protein
LAATRNTTDFPLFALEHDLNSDELRDITRLLHSSLNSGQRLGPNWLVWAIYATELGYDYDGDEYWQTFADRTPQWRALGEPSQIRSWFAKFQSKFHGVEPTGTWAEWFSIIALPITHAILPQYLQLQLARTLYGLRYQLAGLESFEAAAIGKLLSRATWDASSRIGIFLQQEELVGRIVLALLKSNTGNRPGPIFEPTMQRIAADLGRVQSAREWLKETRKVVADRFAGVGRIRPQFASGSTRAVAGEVISQKPLAPSIRPVVTLRSSGPARWSATVELSGFLQLSRSNADLRVFLHTARCQIKSAGTTWLPGGWILVEPQRRVLKTWPNPKDPLIIFEKPNAQLDQLLQSECRRSQGRLWVFRIGRDGIAHEIASRIIRCDQQYVVVSEIALAVDLPCLAPCQAAFDGATMYRLSMPDRISNEDISKLDRLGLHVARVVRIWPAVFVSRGWDGEGHSEWLTTENPYFGIVHDHPAESYGLRLDDGPEIVIGAKAPNVPTFVRLAQLSAGRHILAVAVKRPIPLNPAHAARDAEGIVALDIREPQPWVPGATLHAGMAVTFDPHDATLDEFWNEEVELSIFGPPGHSIHVSVVLFRANGDPTLKAQIGPFGLPLAQAVWSQKLRDFVKSEANTWAYLEASSAELTIRGEELGEYRIQLERLVNPIRWVCRRLRDEINLRLIDETGSDGAIVAQLFSFESPGIVQDIDVAAVIAGVDIRPPGGLYFAQNGERSDAIVVSSPHIEGGLQGLAFHTDLSRMDIAALNTKQILHRLEQWMKSRMVGPLAGLRRDRAVRGLCQSLYARLCGDRWGNAEAAFLAEPNSPSALNDIVASVDRLPGYAIVLQRDFEKLEHDVAERTRWFTAISAQFHVCADKRLVDFALQLAGQPHQLVAMDGHQLDGLLREMSDRTVLLRGARLLALLTVAKRSGGPGSALPRWTWRS